jgi:hypothetical protein
MTGYNHSETAEMAVRNRAAISMAVFSKNNAD